MVNYLNNVFTKSELNTTSSSTHYTFTTYLTIYRILHITLGLNWLNYFEYVYVFANFNKSSANLTHIVYFVYKNFKINTFKINFTSNFKQTSLVYFFHKFTSLKILTIIEKVKGVTTNTTQFFKSQFKIRFSPTNVSKYLHNSYLNLLNILYLRKNKIFNKGRYSRNRQFYRTGVYWCLYINIIAIVGLYFWFYRFVINFGYLWWLLYISLASFIIAKSFNYNLINPVNLYKSIYQDFIFVSSVVSILITNVYKLLNANLIKFFNFSFLNFTKLINNFAYSQFWAINSVWKYLTISHLNLYIWNFTNVNYYIYSVCEKYYQVFFLDTKKHQIFTEFFKMILK